MPTPTQTTTLEAFKSNPDIVPDELSNKLIEDCLEYCYQNYWRLLINISISWMENCIKEQSILSLNEEEKIYLILKLLFRTPDGQAVMSFLDVESKSQKNFKENYSDHYNPYGLYGETKTLDEMLFREFTEALRVGKTFEEALDIINKIYLQNVYV